VERQQKKSRPKDRVAGEKRADPKIGQHGMGKPVERRCTHEESLWRGDAYIRMRMGGERRRRGDERKRHCRISM
jgi:hypothetical protein